MGDDDLSSIVEIMGCSAQELTDILKAHVEELEADGISNDKGPDMISRPDQALDIIDTMSQEIEDDLEPAVKMWLKMAHHIADKIIQETVDRLVEKVRSQSSQLELAATILRLFFEGPEGEIKREELESKVKEEMDIGDFGGNWKKPEFEEVLEGYEKEAEQLALSFAMENAKEMLDACFGVQTEE
ncbi:hypothetical protein D6D01_00700 [Aureobasidium pullulans]|uniref:Uncharacterized protein n=1 Tax=Aureobasidium pullulans TaxID=5580 RepID=A0A4S9M2U4_AURPU|nr:hypothetical protein D6D01_00700 [Aureobasidium pullulans]